MRSPAKHALSHALQRLADSIDGALELIGQHVPERQALPVGECTPTSLLEQCLDLCSRLQVATREPVRTIHHFACTGGTLISKCVAAMPNVQLLSEANPLSPLARGNGKPRFAPADIVTLAAQSTRGARPELLCEIFLRGLEVVYTECVQLGQRMVVRDHAHSDFCVGPDVPPRPTLRTLLGSRFPLLSVVTVRHPLDSFLSLRSRGWLHFTPPTLDEYCARYLAFLSAYEGTPVVRYEDFVATPREVMRTICDTLQLPYREEFSELFGVFALSGDSGRSGTTIEPRARREVDPQLRDCMAESPNYRQLLERVGYDGCGPKC